eukprot:1196008-Prorocentrum_minimum.AAC.5
MLCVFFAFDYTMQVRAATHAARLTTEHAVYQSVAQCSAAQCSAAQCNRARHSPLRQGFPVWSPIVLIECVEADQGIPMVGLGVAEWVDRVAGGAAGH